MTISGRTLLAIAALTTLNCAPAASATPAAACSPTVSHLQAERTHYRQQFVTVADGVRLEVLDWGGTGRPLLLLSGLGNTAHVFDVMAPELALNFHVYGITRRGFGASSVPKTGYTPDRMGADVVAALDKLGISRPIIAGHSIAGEELSAIGNKYPNRIAGLIYLDAAHEYAVYDPQRGGYLPDLTRLGAQVARMQTDPLDKTQMAALLQETTALRQSLARELTAIATDDASAAGAPDDGPGKAGMASFPAFRCFISAQLGGPIPEDEVRQTFIATKSGGVGSQKAPQFVYTSILEGEDRQHAPAVPILSIVPVPRAPDTPAGTDPVKRQAAEAMHTKMQEAEIATLRHQQPATKFVLIPHGHHYVFLSNQSQVVSAITAFAKSLP